MGVSLEPLPPSLGWGSLEPLPPATSWSSIEPLWVEVVSRTPCDFLAPGTLLYSLQKYNTLTDNGLTVCSTRCLLHLTLCTAMPNGRAIKQLKWMTSPSLHAALSLQVGAPFLPPSLPPSLLPPFSLPPAGATSIMKYTEVYHSPPSLPPSPPPSLHPSLPSPSRWAIIN